jgi:penicillin-binding protein 1A
MFGEPEDYYFIDEQGNLVEPGRRPPSDEPFGSDAAPPAASEEFLEQATGGQIPRPQREPRRPPQPQATRPPPDE